MNSSSALGNILNRSHRILERIGHNPSPPTTSPISRTRLTLPDPSPIKSRSFPKDEYMRHAKELQSEWERYMNDAITACLQVVPSTDVRSTISAQYAGYLAEYQRTLARLRIALEQRISDHKYPARIDSEHGGLGKRSFQQNITRTLDQAFLSNPYPTPSEKEAIALATGMDLKQIQVWFQNKRSRCKRDGQTLQRFAFVAERSHPHCGSVEPENNVSGVAFVPENDVSGVDLCRGPSPAANDECLRQTRYPFDIDSPPHAFPTTFPPVCNYDPFPIRSGLQLFDTPWSRRAATERCHSTSVDTSTDIESLCAPLSQLTLTDGPPSKASQRSTSKPRDRVAACFPLLIRAPTAPLPSLVRASVTVRPPNSIRSRPSTDLLLPQHVVPVRTPATPVEQTSGRTSTETPSLRIPHSMPKTARHAAHPYHAGKPSRPRTQQARLSRLSSMSSLSSLASDDSCSSRASSASLESPPPITPPQLSVELPLSRKISSPDLVFSPSEDLDYLFSDSDTTTLNFPDDRQHHQPRIVQ